MGSQVSTRFNNNNQKHLINMWPNFTEILKARKILRRRGKRYFHGDHETCVSENSEGELHTQNVVCEKNPGHTEFIPVETFTLEHLPEDQCDNDLYEFIKAAANLTVKINVKMTSPHRPEFWPGTNDPYPFSHTSETEVLRTGSGMMGEVYKYTDGVDQYGDKHEKNFTTCWCKKCEQSDSPSNVWCEFEADTATHVVFDDIEARHTTLRLFYDRKDSPVVIVYKVSVHHVNIEDDRCRLKCVTCDETLGDKLEEMWKYYVDIFWKVNDKYKYSRSEDRLTFIISHPHGCTKQVSVGNWIKKTKVGEDTSKFIYTTCTCPGSSGATVHCVGYKGWRRWWWYWRTYPGPVHSGTNSEHKYNYSGVGW